MVVQSLFSVTSVSEVVFLKMPSRQEKKRAKRRAKYLQVLDVVLESARASYKADIHSNFSEQRSRKLMTKNIFYEKVGGI